jgi:hypothetical protein
MGLDLWFREDIARILGVAYEAMQSSTDAVSPAVSEAGLAYRQGFEDALRSVAAGFGLVAPGRQPGQQSGRRLQTIVDAEGWQTAPPRGTERG